MVSTVLNPFYYKYTFTSIIWDQEEFCSLGYRLMPLAQTENLALSKEGLDLKCQGWLGIAGWRNADVGQVELAHVRLNAWSTQSFFG